MKKKLLFLLTLSALLFSFAACKKDDADNNDDKKEDTSLLTNTSEGLLSGEYKVEIEVKDYGTIALTLDADTAPVTVTNFVNLVKEGFYDGLTFHRVYSGFMIQGGDPEGNGYGNAKRNIQGEFSANGIKNDLSHTRGVISMARADPYDSASCQFFIVHEDSVFLDGKYAAFGMVTDGMDVVDAICENTPVINSDGGVAAENQPVIKEIRMVE